MPDYKKQHFLTKKYLERFSSGGRVYYFDGDKLKHVPFKDQCQKPYFYSKDKAAFAENILSVGESVLLHRLRTIEASLESEAQMAIALMMAVDLYLKNPKVANTTGRERFDVINGLLFNFMRQQMTSEPPGQESLNALHYGLTIRWRMFLLNSSALVGRQVISSDCPTVLATDTPGSSPCFVFIPLSANSILFFADKSRYHCASSVVELTGTALTRLNLMTAVGAVSRVYSRFPLSKAEQELYRVGIKSPLFQERDRVYSEGPTVKFQHTTMTISKGVIEELSFLKPSKDATKLMTYEEARRMYQSGGVTIDPKTKSITVSQDMSIADLYCVTVAEYIDRVGPPLGHI